MMETMPFIFGKTVESLNFTNREQEKKRLVNNFYSLVNTVIISPRRWGKSSLVKVAAKEIARKNSKIRVCFLDTFNVHSESEFYTYFAKEIVKSTSNKWEEWAQNAKKFLSHLVPKISFSADNQAEVSFGVSLNDIKQSPDEILDLAENLAKSKKIKIIVCIDEFQSIGNFSDTISFQQKLRAHWQHHKNVAYCLYGSKRHMLVDIFANVNMPFYKFGDIMFLNKIENEVWGKFLQKRFNDTNKKITIEQGRYLANRVDNHPYYVQQLAQQVWLRTKRSCDIDIIDEALSSIKDQLALLFAGLVETLSIGQINYLHAIINGEKTFGKETLDKYRIGTSANVNRIKSALQSKDVIDITPNKIEIQDPVFKLWLKENYFKI